MEESSKENRNWYLLWAPAGFGGTTIRIVQVQGIVREFDNKSIVWYPLRPEKVGDRTYLKALYPGYMFVKCIWSPGLEDLLVERLPTYALFLKDPDTEYPQTVSDHDILQVEQMLAEVLKQPEAFRPDHVKIDSDVKILKRAFYGQVGVVRSFTPTGKVVVELPMFGRTVPVSFEGRDLQPL